MIKIAIAVMFPRMEGYASGQYARSLAEFGTPRRLASSRGWILQRTIPGLPDVDAMGPYPLFSCENWPGLGHDLDALANELVSLVLVADPFAEVGPEALSRLFNRGAVAFKTHRVVELGRPAQKFISLHHRRNSAKALQFVDVHVVDRPAGALADWLTLYDILIRRHDIRGISAFSTEAFARQFETPGLVAFRAEIAGETVGMLLWFVQGERAYYHLGAYSALGYEHKASFALFWRSIEHFTGKLRWLNLGAGAGVGDGSGGLDRFKAGWATGTKTAYLCRHVFQPERYEQIVNDRGDRDSAFFPAYRTAATIEASAPRGTR